MAQEGTGIGTDPWDSLTFSLRSWTGVPVFLGLDHFGRQLRLLKGQPTHLFGSGPLTSLVVSRKFRIVKCQSTSEVRGAFYPFSFPRMKWFVLVVWRFGTAKVSSRKVDHIPGLGDQEILADPFVKQLVFVAVSFEACEPTGFPDL